MVDQKELKIKNLIQKATKFYLENHQVGKEKHIVKKQKKKCLILAL
jgi:hypothetical protein